MKEEIKMSLGFATFFSMAMLLVIYVGDVKLLGWFQLHWLPEMMSLFCLGHLAAELHFDESIVLVFLVSSLVLSTLMGYGFTVHLLFCVPFFLGYRDATTFRGETKI